MAMNNVILMGRLTKMPELKQTNSGKEVTSFTIAVDRRFKVNGESVADFHDCVAWGSTAKFICDYFVKGQMICVSGELQTRVWQTDDGRNHKVTEVNVNNVSFCGDKFVADNTSNTDVNIEFEELDDVDVPF